jgi:hypothetical protein
MPFAGSVQTVCATFCSSGSRVKHCFGCHKAGFLATLNGSSHSPGHPRAASASSFGVLHVPASFPCLAKPSSPHMSWSPSVPTCRWESRSRSHKHTRAAEQQARLEWTRKNCKQGHSTVFTVIAREDCIHGMSLNILTQDLQSKAQKLQHE